MKDFIEAILWMLLFGFIIILVCALPTMWLWNWLMPAIFGVTKIGFWQALGINALTGILFRTRISTHHDD